MERIVIRNLPEGTNAALLVLHVITTQSWVPARSSPRLLGEEVPMPVLLAADSGHDIDFEPERLGLIARTPQSDHNLTPTCPLCACRDATRRGGVGDSVQVAEQFVVAITLAEIERAIAMNAPDLT